MRFVDDQHRDLCSDTRQDLCTEAFVRQAFGRDKEDIDFPPHELVLDLIPVIGVIGVDRGGANTHALSRSNLVSHQCKQRRDQQRWTVSGLAQQFRRNKVDKTLSPSGLLNHK